MANLREAYWHAFYFREYGLVHNKIVKSDRLIVKIADQRQTEAAGPLRRNRLTAGACEKRNPICITCFRMACIWGRKLYFNELNILLQNGFLSAGADGDAVTIGAKDRVGVDPPDMTRIHQKALVAENEAISLQGLLCLFELLADFKGLFLGMDKQVPMVGLNVYDFRRKERMDGPFGSDDPAEMPGCTFGQDPVELP